MKRSKRMKSVGVGAVVMTALSTVGIVAGTGSAMAADPVVRAACGTPLTDAEVDKLVSLSDLSTVNEATARQNLAVEAARNMEITQILTDHGDWRGLFGIGLLTIETQAVKPMLDQPGVFQNQPWVAALAESTLHHYLDSIHEEFVGAPKDPQWDRYYSLAKQCDASPARIAMAGYNAHLTVDLAYSIAATHATPENVADYYKILRANASCNTAVIDVTRQAYDADLGPLWRFYFVGEGLDQLAGAGVASGLLWRTANDGYDTVSLANGFALENPQTAPAAETAINAIWSTADTAFGVLAQLVR
ncbi:DUF5995 family protein [Nocardia yamanashiensis]|uniref:DUF5995 family protein n=1 Tax=Nocardia yamanashiensis TaxID=209247 RepID=UPI001E4CD8E5|nr:DUF5995 family protein [Nocardia yamanashiensis]UGT42562.1 DUF5995 family protein [Nocardia yamanashiensis]